MLSEGLKERRWFIVGITDTAFLPLTHPAGHCGRGRPVESGSPQRTQAGRQGECGTLPPPAGTQGVHPEGPMPVRTSVGLGLPDRTLLGPKDNKLFLEIGLQYEAFVGYLRPKPTKRSPERQKKSDFQKLCEGVVSGV